MGNILHQRHQQLAIEPALRPGENYGAQPLAFERPAGGEGCHRARGRDQQIDGAALELPCGPGRSSGDLEPEIGAPKQGTHQEAPFVQLGLGTEQQRGAFRFVPGQSARQPCEGRRAVRRRGRGDHGQIVSPGRRGRGVPHARIIARPAERGQRFSHHVRQM